MKAYSTDLRERIVDAYKKAEGSVRELALRFRVAPKTVQNYLSLERETGSVEPRPHGGGPTPKLDDAGLQEVRTIVEQKSDRTLAEIAKELDVRRDVHVGRTSVWRALDRLGLTRKKTTGRYRPKTWLYRNSRSASRIGRCARDRARRMILRRLSASR